MKHVLIFQNFLMKACFLLLETSSCGKLPANHELCEDEQTGQDESKVLINNMADIVSNFGVFFALKDKDVESRKIFDTIENILWFYKPRETSKDSALGSHNQNIAAPLTKTRMEIWNYFRLSLEQMQPRKPRSTIYDLRANQRESDSKQRHGYSICFMVLMVEMKFEWIIENIIATLYDSDCLSERNPQDKYNPRKIRDVLELLLCICRLKAEDSSILDCNEQRTKLLVKQLKKI